MSSWRVWFLGVMGPGKGKWWLNLLSNFSGLQLFLGKGLCEHGATLVSLIIAFHIIQRYGDPSLGSVLICPQELVECGIQRASDFEWVSRLRYYWRDDVYVDMVQASIIYGYE